MHHRRTWLWLQREVLCRAPGTLPRAAGRSRTGASDPSWCCRSQKRRLTSPVSCTARSPGPENLLPRTTTSEKFRNKTAWAVGLPCNKRSPSRPTTPTAARPRSTGDHFRTECAGRRESLYEGEHLAASGRAGNRSTNVRRVDHFRDVGRLGWRRTRTVCGSSPHSASAFSTSRLLDSCIPRRSAEVWRWPSTNFFAASAGGTATGRSGR